MFLSQRKSLCGIFQTFLQLSFSSGMHCVHFLFQPFNLLVLEISVFGWFILEELFLLNLIGDSTFDILDIYLFRIFAGLLEVTVLPSWFFITIIFFLCIILNSAVILSPTSSLFTTYFIINYLFLKFLFSSIFILHIMLNVTHTWFFFTLQLF